MRRLDLDLDLGAATMRRIVELREALADHPKMSPETAPVGECVVITPSEAPALVRAPDSADNGVPLSRAARRVALHGAGGRTPGRRAR